MARRCTTADEVAAWVKEVWGREERNGPDGQNGQPGPAPRGTPHLLYAEPAANAMHVLIGVACSLLDRQVAALAAAFEKEGGFTERLYRIRQQRRNRPH